MVVQHNIEAANTKRQLGVVNKYLSQSSKKLSSGYRINTASDDAAGLSISEKMRKQIRGLSKASTNAEDGISMVQIADGALEEVQDMLHRMNELSVKSANGTNSATDRQYIQDEIDQIKEEIDRIAETTKFNEIYLLRGTDPIYSFTPIDTEGQTNGNPGKAMARQMTLEELSKIDGTKIFFASDGVSTTQTGNDANTFSSTDQALADILKTQIVPQAVTSFINKLDAFDYLDGSTIGIGLKIYDDSTSPTMAAVSHGWSRYADNSVVPNYHSYSLEVNTHYIYDGSGNITSDKRDDLEVTIIHEMMHALMDEALTNGMTGVKDGYLDTSNRFPGWFAEGMAQVAAGAAYSGNNWLSSIQNNSSYSSIQNYIKNDNLASGTSRSKYGVGYLACMYLANELGNGGSLEARLKNGTDKILTEMIGGKALDQIIYDATGYKSISEFENNFGKESSHINFVSNLLNAIGSGTGGLLTGFSSETPGILDDTVKPGVSLFELNTGFKTVQNVYPDGYVVYSGGGANTTGGVKTNETDDEEIPYIFKVATQRAATNILLHIGADSDRTNKLEVEIDQMNCAGLGITNLHVTTEDSATSAIDTIAEAIQIVSSQRSKLGAYQNRLEHSIKNLDNIVENTTASESTIRDTDMAKEMVAYSNTQILSQAGQSMLAQTKNSKQGILNLLE